MRRREGARKILIKKKRRRGVGPNASIVLKLGKEAVLTFFIVLQIKIK